MERADLSVLPVVVTVDHSLTRESMKYSQRHVKDFLLFSLDRLVCGEKGKAGPGQE